jgi:hypothetical protein
MRNLLKHTAALFLLLLMLAPAAPGQRLRAGAKGGAKAKEPVDEVERLLERHVLALGGLAIFKVRTRIVRGRVELSTSPVPGNFESYEKEPDMEMGIINAPIGQFISATDGVNRWRQAPWGAATTVGLGAGERMVSQARKEKGSFKFRNVFAESRLKGRATVDGREMIVLAATPRGHKAVPMLMYFDAETYLLRKQEPERAAVDEDVNYLKAIYLDSYATVDGVKVPALFRLVTKEFTLSFRVTEVKHNVNIEDGLFRSPEGK